MTKFLDQEIIKGYEIPAIVGRVMIFESTEKEDKQKGNYFGISGCTTDRLYGKTSEEVENQILDEARRYLQNSKKSLQSELKMVEIGFDFITRTVGEINHAPEVNSGGENK